MSANGFINRAFWPLLVGGNAVSFGYGGAGVTPLIVVCIEGEVQVSVSASGALLVTAVATGEVQTEAQVTAPVEVNDATTSGPVQIDAQVTGPVLQLC